MIEMLEKLKSTLEKSPVIKKGEYHYFVSPVTDGIPLTEPNLLMEIVDAIEKKFDLEDIDKIVCIEAMGIHLATALSIKTGIPFVVIRKKKYGLPGEVEIRQVTGYGESNLYVNGVNSGDKILVIDDVVSTGGTLISVINALKKISADIKYVIAVVEKGEGRKKVEKETGTKVNTLVKVDVVDGEVKIINNEV